VLIAEPRIFVQGLIYDAFKISGNVGIETRERHRGLVKNGVKIAPEVSPVNGRWPEAIS